MFRIIQELKPDIVLHTGDLVQIAKPEKKKRQLKKLAELFKQLDCRLGIYNVGGNVDRGMGNWFDNLAGIKTLLSANETINDDDARINLLGLSWEQAKYKDKAFIEQWHQNCKEKEFTILMGHALDYMKDITGLDIDLCLAGHTHGGQVRVPFWGPLLTLSQVPKEWSMGYRRINNIRMNVSAGIGAEHSAGLPSIRFNCPPVITLFTIKKI